MITAEFLAWYLVNILIPSLLFHYGNGPIGKCEYYAECLPSGMSQIKCTRSTCHYWVMTI